MIKIKAITVTVADIRVRAFDMPPSFWIPARLALGITKPRRNIFGLEFAGVIEETGKEITRFQKGDEVFATTVDKFGGYAEYICIPTSILLNLSSGPICFGRKQPPKSVLSWEKPLLKPTISI